MSSLPRPLLTEAPLLALPSAGAAAPLAALSAVLAVLAGACGALSRDTGDSVVDDWLVDALWSLVDEDAISVELWLALTPLDTDCSPVEFTLAPGLTLAPRFTSLFAMLAFAPTPTLGLTFVSMPALPPAAAESAAVVEDWLLDAL